MASPINLDVGLSASSSVGTRSATGDFSVTGGSGGSNSLVIVAALVLLVIVLLFKKN
jgi:hypothetical protein